MDRKLPEEVIIDKSQLFYGTVAHWVSFASCLIALAAPVLILMFPAHNISNPNLIFEALFDGKRPIEIWEAAGVPFESNGFWKLFLGNLFTPDGFAILAVALGCSSTLWGLIPSIWQFAKKKEYLYVCISLFVMVLIALAMSGLVSMAG